MKPFVLFGIGLAAAAMGIYVATADDRPGAAVLGFMALLFALLCLLKAARNRLPRWAKAGAFTLGALVAAFGAFSLHASRVEAPLFAQAAQVPSVGKPTPSRQSASAVARARPLVRAAIVKQNLPGVSIAVGKDGGIVWAEGFGWRDVVTQTPVTPDTRFDIGTAAPVVAPAVASLHMADTGADPATEWSPEHIGEPEEDFPLFTLAHEVILRPLGVSPPVQPLPGERATFYVPRSEDGDPRQGRRLMYMRDLACCADGKAFYSTPSDLVRFAQATSAGNVDGELAGGKVMSLVTRRQDGIVVAVASNLAHADTAAIAQQVADAFAASD